ncbi:MAG: carboxymuconolactone decarboxylase family protein [Planctomycetota bacterium]|nr:carboxymuconolactone decarboxylase family protein [Planctomycetota bacterium]
MSEAFSERDRRLVRLFAASVLGRFDVVRELRRNCASDEPDRRWRETVLQVHVFAGFPRQVELHGVLEESGGLGTFDAGELGTAPDALERGARLFDTIYGKNAPEIRAMLAGHHPDFSEWMHAHAYAKILARDGLPASMRELLACAALAALGQPRQLASHSRGAVRCGASPARVHEVLDVIADLVEPGRLIEARRVLERFASG